MTLDNGYEMVTTFWMDFSIADKFGKNAIKDTFRRAFRDWKDNYIYLTELVIVLNYKIWQWYQKNEDIAKMYNDYWMQAQNYAYENLKGDELRHFYEITD